MFKEIILTFLVAGCVLAFPQPELIERNGRIVGGRDATIEEFPHMVAVLWRNALYCGGTVLNANTIMTGAHCTDGYPASEFSIRAGSNRIAAGGQVVPVARYVQHESFNSRTQVNDICILKLSRNLVMGATVRVATLPVQGFAVPHAATAIITGWGATNRAGDRYPSILQALNTPIIGNTQCAAINGSPIRADQLCAGGVVGRDACYGDTGGPLLFQSRVVGISSWGYGTDCAVGLPMVYTRVSAYLPFITRNL